MRFKLEHAWLSRIPCSECQAFIIDIPRKTWCNRGDERAKRLPGTPTPCGICPRGGPEHEERKTLTERNKRSVELFDRSRAGGLTEAEKEDPIVQETLLLCQRVWDDYLAQQETERLQRLLAPLGLGLTRKV